MFKKIRSLKNRLYRWIYNSIIIGKKLFEFEKRDIDLSYDMALDWIKKNTIPGKGIISNSRDSKKCHLEVTGYLIPTLLDAKEFNLAKQYAQFLSKVQNTNGSFTGPGGGKEYVFDSSQVLKGFLVASKIWPQFKPFAKKTADYIISLAKKNGQIPSMYEGITENIHVFMLPSLMSASKVLGDEKYANIARKSLNYYKNVPNILDSRLITHDLAYIIDGFIDMGEEDFILDIIKEIFSHQSENGKIPAYPNVSWSCSTGIAQFAVIAYKLGMNNEASKALNYLCKIQNKSGGFYGSLGILGSYFNEMEIGWTNKFFMDAVHLRNTGKNK